MQVTIETITPKIADAYLEQNMHNRNARKANVDALARDMTDGNFHMNGDAIRFSETGTLLDGQHRLMACIKAGVKFETVVIRGLPDEAQKTMDSGVNRTAGDALNLYGIASGNTVAAAVKTVHGIYTQKYQSGKMTKQEIFSFYEKNPEISDWVRYSKNAFPKVGSTLTAASFIVSKKYGDQSAKDFVDVFRSGIPSKKGCAAHAIRERLIKISSSGHQITPTNRVKMVLHGAINFAEGRSLSFIRIPEKINCPWINHLFE